MSQFSFICILGFFSLSLGGNSYSGTQDKAELLHDQYFHFIYYLTVVFTSHSKTHKKACSTHQAL